MVLGGDTFEAQALAGLRSAIHKRIHVVHVGHIHEAAVLLGPTVPTKPFEHGYRPLPLRHKAKVEDALAGLLHRIHDLFVEAARLVDLADVVQYNT